MARAGHEAILQRKSISADGGWPGGGASATSLTMSTVAPRSLQNACACDIALACSSATRPLTSLLRTTVM